MHSISQTAAETDRPHVPCVQDERGAILIVGIALGLVLIAAIAELVSVGSSVRAQEAAQAAADASALENAIWHARGMNTVAASNIVMGSLLGVLVSWRLVLAGAVMANAAALPPSLGESDGMREMAAVSSAAVAADVAPAAAAAIEANGVIGARVASSAAPTRALAGRASSAAVAANTAVVSASTLAAIRRVDASLEQRAGWMLAGLSAAQATIAAYAPRLAARNTTAYGGSAGRRIETFSASGWAAVESAPAGAATARVLGSGSTTLATSGAPRSELRPDPARRLASPISLPLELGPALLCEQPRADWAERALASVERSRLAASERERGAERAAKLGEFEPALMADVFCSPAEPTLDALAAIGSEPGALGATRARTAQAPGQGSAAVSHTAIAPVWAGAQVWAAARNGNVYLRSAARLGGPGQGALLAHAEMYFDCDADWAHCEPSAAWQPRWRARLRRVQPLATLLAAAHDDASAWRPAPELPPRAHEPLAGTLPLELAALRAASDVPDLLASVLSSAASEERFIH